jgi:hypothetical protein
MKKAKVVFYISAACFLLSSTAVFAIPFMENTEGLSKIIIGIVFWLFLILGSLMFFILPISKLNAKRDKVGKQAMSRGQPTFLIFWRNLYAIIFDGLLTLSIIANIIFVFISTPQFVQSIAIFLLLFSIEMHLIFNSNRYEYIFGINKNKFGGRI